MNPPQWRRPDPRSKSTSYASFPLKLPSHRADFSQIATISEKSTKADSSRVRFNFPQNAWYILLEPQVAIPDIRAARQPWCFRGRYKPVGHLFDRLLGLIFVSVKNLPALDEFDSFEVTIFLITPAGSHLGRDGNVPPPSLSQFQDSS